MMWWGGPDGLTAGDIDHVHWRPGCWCLSQVAAASARPGWGFPVVIDEQVMLDETITLPPGADVVESMMKPPQELALSASGRGMPGRTPIDRPAGGARAVPR
jgi:hypothetical protein